MRVKRKLDKKNAVQEIGGYAGRIIVVGLLLTAFLGVCLVKVGYLQLVKGRELVEEYSPQVQETLDFFAKRGKILDRGGNVLAMTVETKGIQVFRPAVTHPDYVVETIAGLLAIDEETARRKALCRSKYCYVERFVDPKIAEPLEFILDYRGDDPQVLWQQERLAGVQVVRAAGRLYPFGELAGQVVGVARVPTAREDGRLPSPMELEGQYGIEAALDKTLEGKPIVQRGLKRQKQDLALLPDNPDLVLAGNSALLTIDVNIQRIAEQELERAVLSSLARRGIAMVMDVKTGELLGVAHYPPFNPNGTSTYSSDELWKWNDAAFIEIFEPGSTMKPLIVAAALNEGVITMDDVIFCENGSWKVAKREKPIKDHARYGFLTVWDIIKFSSNIGSGKIGLKLGAAKLHEYLGRYGFGERTGVKPGNHEARGLINKGGRGWSDMEIANISFGQGIAVTAVQMLAAMASLGNDGVLMKPLLVKEILDGSGKSVARFEPEPARRVVSKSAARHAVAAMRKVVEPGGTGEQAAVFGFDTAGKTGTAQKVMTVEDPNWAPGGKRSRPARRSTYVDKWIGSFIGLVPANDPRLAVLVVVDEPYLSDYGGLVAAPAFARIARRTLTHLNVVPAEEVQHSAVETVNNSAPAGEEASQSPAAPMHKAGAVGPSNVPDFSGMTVGQALHVAWQSRLRIVADGAGVATSQNPEPGAVVDEWGDVRVRFGDPVVVSEQAQEEK